MQMISLMPGILFVASVIARTGYGMRNSYICHFKMNVVLSSASYSIMKQLGSYFPPSKACTSK